MTARITKIATSHAEYEFMAGDLAGQVELFSPETMLCPLDGARTVWGLGEFLTCTRCREILTVDEVVASADQDTWGAYLSGDTTDTAVEDAPLARVA